MVRVSDTWAGGCWRCCLLLFCALFPGVPLGRRCETNPTQEPNGSRGSKCYLSLLCCRPLMGNPGTIKLTEKPEVQRTPLAELLSGRRLLWWAAGRFPLPDPGDSGEPPLPRRTLTLLNLLGVLRERLASCLLPLCGLSFQVVHCCFTPTWDFDKIQSHLV